MDDSHSPSDVWKGEFGERWTDRNAQRSSELDEAYLEAYGVTRSELNEQFLEGVDGDARILEIGANTGAQLRCLRQLGFLDLYGVELLEYAVRQANEMKPSMPIFLADAMRLPFEDRSFDLVFTSGLLIHVPPDQIGEAMLEIARCADRYIWGFEYFAPEYTEVDYRNHDNLLWKADFPRLYEEHCEFTVVKERQIEYVDSDNVDVMFLLERDE